VSGACVVACLPFGWVPSLHALRRRSARFCSSTSTVLWTHPTPHPGPNSFVSPTSCCGPRSPWRWRDRVRSPRFRRVPFVRDVLFDHGRASAPRITGPHMLPSTLLTDSASATFWLSRLNPTPRTIAVYASQPPSPNDHATLATGRPLRLTRAGLPPAGPRQPPGAQAIQRHARCHPRQKQTTP